MSGWKYKWKMTLQRPLECDVKVTAPDTFCNPWLLITPQGDRTLIVVSDQYSWDGCSVVPDAPGTRRASCVHDAFYQFSEEIAKAWGWTPRKVMRLGDECFLRLMRADGCPCAGLYYAGVRAFGGAFHSICKLFA